MIRANRHLCQVGGQLLLTVAQSGVTEPEQSEGSIHTVGGLVQCVEASQAERVSA